MSPRLGDRSLFPTLETDVYANFAGMSPCSTPVHTAIRGALEALARRGGAAGWDLLTRRDAVRDAAARLVGAQAHEVGFVPNTTAGVRAAAFGLPWTPGDRVVCFAGEFPANVTPWQRAAAMNGGEIVMLAVDDYVDDPEVGLARLERVLEAGRVRAVAVSAVQFQSGLRMPLRAMAERCRAHGAWLCVDAIQACGVVPIDVVADGIDILACGGHKWLGGSMGLGFWVLRDRVVERLRPAVAGWTSHEDAADFLLRGAGHLRYDRPLRRRADFVEDGGFAIALLPGLEAALGILHALGVEAIYEHVQRWIDALEPELIARGFTSLRAREPNARSGILSVLPPHGVDVIALHAALEQRGIGCATPDGALRFAPHWSNAPGEIPRVLAALEKSIAQEP